MKKDWVQVRENLISLFYDIVLSYRSKALKREQAKWVGKKVIIDVYPTFDYAVTTNECVSVELRRKLFTKQWFVYFVSQQNKYPARGLYIKEAIDKSQ